MVYIKSCKGLYKNEKTKMPASDLVLEPVKEVIKDMDALDIDGIICATITKDYVYPSASCMLGGKINAKNAFCYDIESDFTGFISALRLAYSFVESKRYKNVLAVSSESFYICDDKDRFNDASVASLITSEKSNIQIDFIDSTTDGSALENCYIPMGGAVKPYTREGIINENGAFDISKCDLIAYSNGNYYSLGKKIGRFGFSVQKKKKTAKKSGKTIDKKRKK